VEEMSRLVVLVYTSSRTKRMGWSINKEEGEPASDVYMDLKTGRNNFKLYLYWGIHWNFEYQSTFLFQILYDG
jgi:hypothetical protein